MADLVLVFGESLNDARAIAELVVAVCPELEGLVRAAPRPTSLTRGAKASKIEKWAETVAGVVRAYHGRGKTVRCVFVHRDSDQPDLSGRLERETNSALRDARVEQAHAVVPVHAIEAWWLHFPEAVEASVRGWAGALLQQPGNVDAVTDPKRELVRRTRRKLPRRPYSESDSVRIAANIRVMGIARAGRGRSASYARFVSAIEECCAAS